MLEAASGKSDAAFSCRRQRGCCCPFCNLLTFFMYEKYKKERKLFRKSSYAWAFLEKANVLMKSFKITFQRKVVVATRSQCPIGFLCIILFFIVYFIVCCRKDRKLCFLLFVPRLIKE